VKTSDRVRGRHGMLAMSLAVAVLLLLSAVRQRAALRAGVQDAAKRQAIGEVSLPVLGGGRWRLADHSGQVVAINLWATWCGPCQEETPTMVRAVRELGPNGFTAVGVSMDDDKGESREAKVRAFAGQYGLDYPVAFPDPMSQMASGLQGIPTTILLDRKGRVAKTYVGAVREGVLRRDVETLLAEGE